MELFKTNTILGSNCEDGVYYIMNKNPLMQLKTQRTLLKCYNVIARDINKDDLTIWQESIDSNI